MSDVATPLVPTCRDCGREFPHLPGYWARKAMNERDGWVMCGACSIKPNCHAPQTCPTQSSDDVE